MQVILQSAESRIKELEQINIAKAYKTKIKAKAVISKSEALLFTQDKADELKEFLINTKYNVFVDKSTINGYDYSLLGNKAKDLTENPIKKMKSQKTPQELEHL